MKDYYKILGVPKNASADDIKKAFRKLAHIHHPDKAGGNETKFKEINEAYQTLGNKDKRNQYDQFGGQQDTWSQNKGFWDFTGSPYFSQEDIKNDFINEDTFNNLFSDLFKIHIKAEYRNSQFRSEYQVLRLNRTETFSPCDEAYQKSNSKWYITINSLDFLQQFIKKYGKITIDNKTIIIND